ncbi:Predicted antitoxin, CopG family [Haladaptatus litoreus]|uniref:Predicted antitoxin, CopG family n=1 Tax=Haladaptatus litoreus TaxID=553468 RepID=A0A1N6UW63_9EURY|nr:antitoxin VapB family protein [Haladaptatus litoreus]SIQ69476.1 Predicted antitoxin, CopG family [Haladaptatus litoreus]
MGAKNISLDNEAYEKLRVKKREGESFSDVVKRLAGERSLLEIAGILSDEEADELWDAIEERRAEREREPDDIADRMK